MKKIHPDMLGLPSNILKTPAPRMAARLRLILRNKRDEEDS